LNFFNPFFSRFSKPFSKLFFSNTKSISKFGAKFFYLRYFSFNFLNFFVFKFRALFLNKNQKFLLRTTEKNYFLKKLNWSYFFNFFFLKHFFFNSQKKKIKISKNFLSKITHKKWKQFKIFDFSFKFNKFAFSYINFKFLKFFRRKKKIKVLRRNIKPLFFFLPKLYKPVNVLKSLFILPYNRKNYNLFNFFFRFKILPFLMLHKNNFCNSLNKNSFSFYSKVRRAGVEVKKKDKDFYKSIKNSKIIKKNHKNLFVICKPKLNYFSSNLNFSRAFCFYFKNFIFNRVAFLIDIKN
jgi:hypothetical protein